MDALAAVDEALDRIGRSAGALNAYCLVLGERARDVARDVQGPLAGFTTAIKESVWMAGLVASDGSRARAGFVPRQSAAAVDRLEAAGAVVVGRTNLPELCYRGVTVNELYGETANPWDVTRTPGGSSGGSGAAVAAGLSRVALGGDGGGSIRIPASFCGIVGLKASYGLVPVGPGHPGWLTLTQLGPMARNVADCAAMLDVLAGPDARDPTTLPALGGRYGDAAREPGDLRGLRVAYSADLGYVRSDPGVREAFARAVERFATLGCELEEAHPGLANPIDVWNTIACGDNWASDADVYRSGLAAADTQGLIEAGRDLSGGEYVAARNAMAAYAGGWGRFMQRYDLMLTPTMELVAFPLGRYGPEQIDGQPVGEFYDDYCHFCYPFNLTGQPAISVPMGTAEAGMPCGLQIVGRRFADELVLRAAAAWERIAPWPHAALPESSHGPLPAALADAVAGGAGEVALPGLAPGGRGHGIAAGLVVSAGGRTARVARAWSPERGGPLVVTLEAA